MTQIELSDNYLERLCKEAEMIIDLEEVIGLLNAEIDKEKLDKAAVRTAAKDLITDAIYMQSLIFEQRHAIICLMDERERIDELGL